LLLARIASRSPFLAELRGGIVGYLDQPRLDAAQKLEELAGIPLREIASASSTVASAMRQMRLCTRSASVLR
jgi:hypothetical protein